MERVPKSLICQCGKTVEVKKAHAWCLNCGQQLFYDDKAKAAHKRNRMFGMACFLLFITTVVYFFIEIVVRPTFG